MGFGKFWLKTKRLSKVIDRPIEIAASCHNSTQIVVCLHKIRLDLQSCLKMLSRLQEATLPSQHVRQIKMSAYMCGIDLQSLTEMIDRLLEIAFNCHNGA